MASTYADFTNALEYLVSIEPDPEMCEDEDRYDAHMAPYAADIEYARCTVRLP